MRSRSLERYVLPLIIGILSLALFQLALHGPADARLYSYLSTESIPAANEYEGIYATLLGRFIDLVGDAALTMRLLAAICSGLAVFFALRSLASERASPAQFLLTNIVFLFYAFHSPTAMLALAWFAALLWSLTREGELRWERTALIATLGLGIDSLVASAVSLYVLVRALIEGEPKAKVRTLASLLLGLTAWLLFAYMLYGSDGFATAIASGFESTFTQINPINFGVAVLLGLNVLLPWVFRSPSQRTPAKYLGSVMIALFLFVRIEPHHALMLLLVALVYLHATDALPKHKLVLPIYAVTNIAALFLLPYVEPKEANYNVRAERLSEAEAYYSDHFAKHLPSFQALKAKADHFEGVTDLYARNKGGQAIILDPATETSFASEGVRELSNEHEVAGYRPVSRRFQTVWGRDTSMMDLLRASPTTHYIASAARPRAIDSLLTAWRAPEVNAAGLTIFAIDSAHYQEFFDAYIFNHYLSYH